MKTVGVLGLGSIGMRHAENIRNAGHCVSGWDPKKHISVSSEDEFWEQGLDAIVIATPSEMHCENIEHAINVHPGCPVLVEKPEGSTEKDLRILKSLDLSKVWVGNNLRFHPSVQQVKEWMPFIGTPEKAQFTCAQFNDKPAYLRDGVTLNWGAHEVDLALYLLGPAQVIGARIWRDDSCCGIDLQHDNGCITNIYLDYLKDPQVRGFEIVGSEKSVAADLVEAKALLSGSGTTWDKDFDWNQIYIEEMKDFLENGGQNCATGAEGLAVLEVLLEAKRKAGL